MNREEFSKRNDEHNGRILQVDNEVITDLRKDVTEGLGQNDMKHGLKMSHADGLCTFCLSGIYRNNTTADRFCHICTGVDGNDNNGSKPNTGEAQCIIGEIGKSVVNEHGLQDHRCSTEYFDVNTNNDTYDLQEESLNERILFGVWNCVQNAAQKTDDDTDNRTYN